MTHLVSAKGAVIGLHEITNGIVTVQRIRNWCRASRLTPVSHGAHNAALYDISDLVKLAREDAKNPTHSEAL